MDKVRAYLNKPLVTAAVGFVVGLFIGLFVLGWGLFPVEWKDASTSKLRQDLKEDTVRMMVESYAKNQDKTLALTRWKELGEEGPNLLTAVQKNPGKVSNNDIIVFSQVVQVPLAGGLPVATAAPTKAGAPQPTAAPGSTQAAPANVAPTAAGQLPAAKTALPTEAPAGSKSSLIVIFVVLCLATLVIGAALVYFFVFRNRKGGKGAAPVARSMGGVDFVASTEPVSTLAPQENPVAQFMTTYRLGDDLYDDSFSIDSSNGDFLGECGVGISETIGVGDPKKATAFEVWLFDKNDIQTVTKVLMSSQAFDNPEIKQRVASKGEPVLAQPGLNILLETATLQLEARVVDMNYGQGPLPAESYFDHLTLELAVWPKNQHPA